MVDERDMRASTSTGWTSSASAASRSRAQAVRLTYTSAGPGETYLLNLIDTPGHVDFTYEVSRSLAGVRGAVLLVDAARASRPRRVANALLAIDADLHIVPVLNKIDLPSAQPDESRRGDRSTDRAATRRRAPRVGQDRPGRAELLERSSSAVPPSASSRRPGAER